MSISERAETRLIKIFELSFTAVALVVAIYLYCTTREQVNISKEANDTTASALRYQRARDAVNDSIQWKRDSILIQTMLASKHNEEQVYATSKEELRAYVVIEGVDSVDVDSSSWFYFFWNSKNAGATPAKQLREVIVCDTAKPITRDSLMSIRLPIAEQVLGANSPHRRRVNFRLSKAIIHDLILGKRPIYVGWKIQYRDIFGTVRYALGHLKFHNLNKIEVMGPNE